MVLDRFVIPSMTADAASFLGSIVGSKWEQGWPFARLVIERDQLFLKSPVREDRALSRPDVLSISVERVRCALVWRTVIWFGLQTGALGFVPYRTRPTVTALRERGWKVEPARSSTS